MVSPTKIDGGLTKMVSVVKELIVQSGTTILKLMHTIPCACVRESMSIFIATDHSGKRTIRMLIKIKGTIRGIYTKNP